MGKELDNIDLTRDQRKEITSLLARYLPDAEVWAYGSRAKFTSKPHSDLDMVAFPKPEQKAAVYHLKEAFEESDLPFRVDLFVWNDVPEQFHKNIKAEHVVLQEAEEDQNLPKGWQCKKISEIADIIGGGTPKTKTLEYWGGNIPWLTPKDLSGEHPRYVSRGGRNITEAGLDNSSARVVPPKTVLLTSRAPVGYVAIAKNPITTNQGFRSLVVNDENDPDFVYYLLLNSTDYLKQHAAGSTFQELSGGTLKGLEFLVPPLKEQKAISHILGTLDDKIELNRRMNETLEGIARAIFKSWFVDFDPVRAKAERRDTGLPKEIEDLFPDRFEDSETGPVPSGWQACRWGQIATVEYGKGLRNRHKSHGKFRVFGTNGPIGWCDEALCTGPGIIVGRKGAYRGVHYCSKPFYVIDTAFYVRKRAEFDILWAYYSLLDFDINTLDSGSAIPSTSRGDFENIRVCVPPASVQDYFGAFVGSCHDTMDRGTEQAATLSLVRSALMQPLLQGDLRLDGSVSAANAAHGRGALAGG